MPYPIPAKPESFPTSFFIAKRYGIPLISITKNPNSTLGKTGDILLKLPDDGEACPLGLAPTSSTTATLVLGDILAVCLLERKGFSKTDFRQRHPGGKLGSFLQKVSDLMHKGGEMPLVKEGTPMQNALLEMTSKMLGCVGIVGGDGRLLGIITDGDLRRCLAPDMLSKKADDVMTRNPKTVAPDVLAAEAVNTMNNTGKGITQLFCRRRRKTSRYHSSARLPARGSSLICLTIASSIRISAATASVPAAKKTEVSRHTRIIRLTKLLLPAIAALLIGLLILFPSLKRPMTNFP